MWISKKDYEELQKDIRTYKDNQHTTYSNLYEPSCKYMTTFRRIENKLKNNLNKNTIERWNIDDSNYLEVKFKGNSKYRIDTYHHKSSICIDDNIDIALIYEDAKALVDLCKQEKDKREEALRLINLTK